MQWPQSFKAAFCSYYRCAEEDFLRRAFWKFMHRWAWPVAGVLRVLWPSFFQVDRDALERVGESRSWEELDAELRAFQDSGRLRSRLLHRRLRLRVSCGRIRKCTERLLGPPPKRTRPLPSRRESGPGDG